MSKILFAGLGLGLAAWYLGKASAKANTTNTTTLPQLNPGTGTVPFIDPNVQQTNVPLPPRTMGAIATEIAKPNYQTWRAMDWSKWYQALIAQKGIQEATQELAQNFYVQANPYWTIFKDLKTLVLALFTNPIVVAVGEIIDWNSTPKYCNLQNQFYGITCWDCADWKTYHQKLEAHYRNTNTANQIWRSAWNDSENFGFGRPGWDCSVRTAGCAWFEYFYSKGIDLYGWGDGAVCSVINFGSAMVGTATNIAQGAQNTAKVLSYVVPIAAGVFVYTRYIRPNL